MDNETVAVGSRSDRWAVQVTCPARYFFVWLAVEVMLCAPALLFGGYVHSTLGRLAAVWSFEHRLSFPVQMGASVLPPLILAALLAVSAWISGLRRRWWVPPA